MKYSKFILLLLISLLIFPAESSYAQKREKKHNYTTHYINGKTYKTTGNTKVKRNSSAKKEFLREHGYKKVPSGYDVDHIKPLFKGGTDTPDNMQLITKSQHKIKTAEERHESSKSKYKPSKKKSSYHKRK